MHLHPREDDWDTFEHTGEKQGKNTSGTNALDTFTLSIRETLKI